MMVGVVLPEVLTSVVNSSASNHTASTTTTTTTTTHNNIHHVDPIPIKATVPEKSHVVTKEDSPPVTPTDVTKPVLFTPHPPTIHPTDVTKPVLFTPHHPTIHPSRIETEGEVGPVHDSERKNTVVNNAGLGSEFGGGNHSHVSESKNVPVVVVPETPVVVVKEEPGVIELRVAQWQFDGDINESQLTFAAGEIIRVLPSDIAPEGWALGETSELQGFFPFEFYRTL